MSGQSFRERIRAYMTGCTVEEADALLDGCCGDRDAEIVQWLVKKAREFRALGTRQGTEQADTAAMLASKISRGAVRPNNLRMLSDPGFFEVDRTYRHHGWTFRVVALAPHPDTGVLHAVGWMTHAGITIVGRLDGRDWESGKWADTASEVTA